MKHVLLALLAATSIFAGAAPYPVTIIDSPFKGSRFYVPTDGQKHPSVVMLHGSEGGSMRYIDPEAAILASMGYQVLVYCYFDCMWPMSGPHETLKNVEATKVLEAVKWLRERPEGNGKVAVYGFSRGAEFTMLLGSIAVSSDSWPDALIAHSPSDVANEPYNDSWEDQLCWTCTTGRCDPNSRMGWQWNPACGPDDPSRIDLSHAAWLVNGSSLRSGERIQIERYTGPVMITVGLNDHIWPVDQTRRIEQTLIQAGHPAEVHYFPGQDHVFTGPDETTRRGMVADFLAMHL